MRRWLLGIAVLGAAACGGASSSPPNPDGSPSNGGSDGATFEVSYSCAVLPDLYLAALEPAKSCDPGAGVAPEAGVASEAGVTSDGGLSEAAVAEDGGLPESGVAPEAGVAQCQAMVTLDLVCGCQTFVNDPSRLAMLAAQWTAQNCAASVPSSVMMNCVSGCFGPQQASCAAVGGGGICVSSP